MGSWQVALGADTVLATAYLGICLAVVVPLARSRQLRSNPLGTLTAALFLVGAVHHGAHAVHALLPSLGVADPQGLASRAASGWLSTAWGLAAAAVALAWWAQRRASAPVARSAQLFPDLRQRERQALELHDGVLQGLVVAKMALDLDQPGKADEALSASIDSASRMITELLGSPQRSLDLLRSGPAAVVPPTPVPAGAGAPERSAW